MKYGVWQGVIGLLTSTEPYVLRFDEEAFRLGYGFRYLVLLFVQAVCLIVGFAIICLYPDDTVSIYLIVCVFVLMFFGMPLTGGSYLAGKYRCKSQMAWVDGNNMLHIKMIPERRWTQDGRFISTRECVCEVVNFVEVQRRYLTVMGCIKIFDHCNGIVCQSDCGLLRIPRCFDNETEIRNKGIVIYKSGF